MTETELIINKIAQGIISLEDGLLWFSNESIEERDIIMRALDSCIFQAHPTELDIQQGLKNSQLKETYSPCVLVVKKHFNEARQKVLKMSGLDQQRAFQLFLSIFSVADQRRRVEQCQNGCSHEWHNI